MTTVVPGSSYPVELRPARHPTVPRPANIGCFAGRFLFGASVVRRVSAPKVCVCYENEIVQL